MNRPSKDSFTETTLTSVPLDEVRSLLPYNFLSMAWSTMSLVKLGIIVSPVVQSFRYTFELFMMIRYDIGALFHINNIPWIT